MDERLKGILAEKPRLIVEFPDWMFPPSLKEELRSKELAIAEIAGRDSVAACILAARQRPLEAILPTIAYTGTEFGSWDLPRQGVELLRQRLKAEGVRVYEPVFLGDPEFWRTLCGGALGSLTGRYGFITPCLGCHLYLHAIRVPLALMLGCRRVISGERERHDHRVKLNQVAPALDAYKEFFARMGLELLMPLREVASGEEVEAILGTPWPEGKGQMGCVLSGNYLDEGGNPPWEEGRIRAFFQEFAFPKAEEALRGYLRAVKGSGG